MYNGNQNVGYAQNGMYQNPNQQYSYTYENAHRRVQNNNQVLTQEQIDILSKKNATGGLSINFKREDLWGAVCTHKYTDGTSSLYVDPQDGKLTCKICGAKIDFQSYTLEQVKNACDTVMNMMQLTKLMYLDAPESFVSNYYQCIALLKMLPDVWDAAVRNYNMYEPTGNFIDQMYPGMPVQNGFAYMQNMLGGNAFYNQPMYQPPYQQPPVYQQPQGYYQPNMVAPNYGTPAPNGYNPFMYGGQQPPVQQPPQAAPVAPAPGQMPPAAPQTTPSAAAPAPTQTAEVQQQKTFNIV